MTTYDPQQILNTAITALKLGNRTEGKRLLFQVVDLDPRNERAYMLLSFLMETRYERIACLEKILDINPENSQAWAALQELQAGPGGGVHKDVFIPDVPAGEAEDQDIRDQIMGDHRPEWMTAAGIGQETGPGQPLPTQVVTPQPAVRAQPEEAQAAGKRIAGFKSTQFWLLVGLGLLVIACLIVTLILILPNVANSLKFLTGATQPATVSAPVESAVAVLPATATSTLAVTATVQPTLTAEAPIPTAEPPTATLEPPTATLEVVPTATPEIPATPTLEPGGTRTLVMSQKIGPITGASGSYTLQVTLGEVRFATRDSRYKLPKGGLFMIIDLEIRNLGPEIASGTGNFGFNLRDAAGVLHHPLMIDAASQCFLGTIDIPVNQTHRGCVAFAVPGAGGLTLEYQPVWDEPELVLRFTLR